MDASQLSVVLDLGGIVRVPCIWVVVSKMRVLVLSLNIKDV